MIPASFPSPETQNLAARFLARGFTVSRAEGAAEGALANEKGRPSGPPFTPMCVSLLVVLTVEKARNVDRVALVARLVLVIELRLGRAASNIRHALEQCAAARRRCVGRLVVLWRCDRRRAYGAGQDVVGSEQQLILVILSRDFSLGLGL